MLLSGTILLLSVLNYCDAKTSILSSFIEDIPFVLCAHICSGYLRKLRLMVKRKMEFVVVDAVNCGGNQPLCAHFFPCYVIDVYFGH